MNIENLTKSVVMAGIKAAKSDDGRMIISGYGSTFNGSDSYGDTIKPGAYKNTIKTSGGLPKMLYHHDRSAVPVGVWTKAVEDEKGLYLEGELADTERGRELYTVAKMLADKGQDFGLSIGYGLTKDDYEEKAGGGRNITNVTLLSEVSLTPFPADKRSGITEVKAQIEGAKTLKDFERILRDSGFSKAAATAFVSGVKGVQGEPESSSKATLDDAKSILAELEFKNTLNEVLTK